MTARTASASVVFFMTLAIRTRGISREFWLLGDQIRDWGIALQPLAELPLVGPPTHVHGYTIGPAYYWLMWCIRVTMGPWFDNLPHGGGIGQAIVESGADAVLFVAVWQYASSFLLAMAATLLIATAPYDVALSAIVWNPPVSAAFNKIAIALVLLRWPANPTWRAALVTVAAWSALQIHTGSVFVTGATLAALLIEACARGDHQALRRQALAIAAVIFVLQLPYLAHQVSHRFSDPAMEAVTGGLRRIASGSGSPEFAKSVAGYAGAVRYIQGQPWSAGFLPWVLLACAVVVAIRRYTDPVLLALLLGPQAAAIVGYSLYLGALDHYYYLSLMPAVVLTLLLGAIPRTDTPAGRLAGIVLVVTIAAIAPARLRTAATMHRMPEYAALVKASRTIAGLKQPMRAIRTEFPLHPATDATFLYSILGGRLAPDSPWIAIIAVNGQVRYEQIRISR